MLSLLSFIIKEYFFLVFHSLQKDGVRTKCLVTLPLMPEHPVVLLMDPPMVSWPGSVRAGNRRWGLWKQEYSLLQLWHKTLLLAGTREGCLDWGGKQKEVHLQPRSRLSLRPLGLKAQGWELGVWNALVSTKPNTRLLSKIILHHSVCSVVVLRRLLPSWT